MVDIDLNCESGSTVSSNSKNPLVLEPKVQSRVGEFIGKGILDNKI